MQHQFHDHLEYNIREGRSEWEYAIVQSTRYSLPICTTMGSRIKIYNKGLSYEARTGGGSMILTTLFFTKMASCTNGK